MKTCLIISGGDYSPIDETIKYDYCIACDKGFEYAKRDLIVPDLVLGDFDSYEGDILEDIGEYNAAIEVKSYPIEKDDTDTMLAIKEAVLKKCKHIVIACALGGRLDHTLANIQSMAYAASIGCVCELHSENEYMRTLSSPNDNMAVINRTDDTSLSLFSLTDECTNLTIKGAKYNTDNITLRNNFPLGLGNTWIDDKVTITFDEGILLIVLSKM